LYFILGGVLALAGLILFADSLVRILHSTDNLTQIVVPGEEDLPLMPNLTYTIFFETKSVVNGRVYSTTESANGLTCMVISRTSGNKIDTRSPAMNTTYSLSDREGRSMLEFVTDEAGVYNIDCEYKNGSEGTQMVIAVGSGVDQKLVSAIGRGLASFFGGVILGVGIIVKGYKLRKRQA